MILQMTYPTCWTDNDIQEIRKRRGLIVQLKVYSGREDINCCYRTLCTNACSNSQQLELSMTASRTLVADRRNANPKCRRVRNVLDVQVAV